MEEADESKETKKIFPKEQVEAKKKIFDRSNQRR